MTDLMRKMKRSGYSANQREEVLRAGLEGYYRMVRNEMIGGRKVNRGKEEGREEREAKKLTGPSTWFQQERKDEEQEEEIQIGLPIILSPFPTTF